MTVVAIELLLKGFAGRATGGYLQLWSVLVPARSSGKAQAATKGIPRVELEPMELMDPASIDAFAQRFLDQVLNGVLPWAIDPDLASRLWRLSEQLTGTTFVH